MRNVLVPQIARVASLVSAAALFFVGSLLPLAAQDRPAPDRPDPDSLRDRARRAGMLRRE